MDRKSDRRTLGYIDPILESNVQVIFTDDLATFFIGDSIEPSIVIPREVIEIAADNWPMIEDPCPVCDNDHPHPNLNGVNHE